MSRPVRRADARDGRRGFTLIELTVILAVIVTLALILTPSIANMINDSRVARARTDCQTIAGAIVQFYRDNGFFPEWTRSVDGGPGRLESRLDLLVTAGTTPKFEAEPAGVLAAQAPSVWQSQLVGNLADQLLTNGPGYALRSTTTLFGWNGPYLSSPIGSDPWNSRYMVNIGGIDASQGALTAAGTAKTAVWVLSAGSDRTIQTPSGQSITNAVLGGDDIGVRIQ